MKILLKHGAVVDVAVATHGAAPLSAAAQCGNFDACALLLEAEADPNQVRKVDSAPPIVLAAMEGKMDIVQLLASYGAALGHVPEGHPNWTAHALAESQEHHALARWLKLAAGKWSPFQIAIGARFLNAAMRLLNAGDEDPDKSIAYAASIVDVASAEHPWLCLSENAGAAGGAEGTNAVGEADGSDGETDPRMVVVPVCKQVVKLALAVTQAWGPSRHRYYHREFKDAVAAVVHVAARLEAVENSMWVEFKTRMTTSPMLNMPSLASGDVEQDTVAGGDGFAQDMSLPSPPTLSLPSELWLSVILTFLSRRDWPAKKGAPLAPHTDMSTGSSDNHF